MTKVILNRNTQIAFRYEEGGMTEEIYKLIDLDIAFICSEMDENTKLFVKVGEYEKGTKKKPAINKYSNVPIGYWIVLSDFINDHTGEIVYIKKVEIISHKRFMSKYSILTTDEPLLFEEKELTEV